MGRELRRVPLDFDWPLNEVWYGFICPYQGHPCKPCDGTGYNPATRQLADDWYDFEKTGRRWIDKLTQDEVAALVKEGRLVEFYQRWDSATKKYVNVRDPSEVTADEVNAAADRPMTHDSINRWICIETRAKRLGIWGTCKWCKGKGALWSDKTAEKLADKWKSKLPPTGPGYQVWETVTEGSPISPVFASLDAVVQWLIGEGYALEDARAFAKQGWTPSGVVVTEGGKTTVHRDVEGCGVLERAKETGE